MRAVDDGEATVQHSPFALRFALLNDTEEAAKVKINVTAPLLCQLDPLDWESMNDGDRSPTLPTAGDPAVRWLIANREIEPGDVAVVDVKVELAGVVAGVAEVPLDLVFHGIVGDLDEQITVAFGVPAA